MLSCRAQDQLYFYYQSKKAEMEEAQSRMEEAQSHMEGAQSRMEEA
jgi:hypothetical protein